MDERQFEVKLIVAAKSPLQAAGRCLIGPNKRNQAFVTELYPDLALPIDSREQVFMLDELGDVKEVTPAAEENKDVQGAINS